MERNGAEVDHTDVTSSTRVPPVKIHHQVRHMNIIPRFSGVVFNTKTLPLDQVTMICLECARWCDTSTVGEFRVHVAYTLRQAG